MEKKNKGLADNHDGDIILNESGTSVSFGWDTKEEDADNEDASLQEGKESDKPKSSGETDSRCIS